MIPNEGSENYLLKMPYFSNSHIPTSKRKEYLTSKEFKDDLTLKNIQNGKLLALVIIVFESIFLLIDVICSFQKVSNTFSFYSYLAMYFIMIFFNLIYLFLIDCFTKNRFQTLPIDALITLYLTLVMVWGSVISLMDQKLYGQLISFMVNMITCSIIYLMNAKMMSVPYLISTTVLAVGLPFFQSSGNILIGHYVNLLVFIVISWMASRILYRNHCDNYIINKLMNQSNILLERETEENKIINRKLEIANTRLKNLTLLDELTGLPNRRKFREFIDKALQYNAGSDFTISVIMIDIDYFKQYNDCYGHDNGDIALSAVARQIGSIVENTDQVAVRWGGEEFLYAALNATQETVIETANTLRLKICGLKISNQNSQICPYITISLGTCTGVAANINNINRIIKIADQALYRAKNCGRNRVITLGYEEESL